MSVQLVVGGLLLLVGLWVVLNVAFPAGPQVRLLAGAGHIVSRGARGVFADPSAAAGHPADVPRQTPDVDLADRLPAPPPTPAGADVMVALGQTLAALEEVLSGLQQRLAGPALADAGGVVVQGNRLRVTPARAGVTVATIVGESMPGSPKSSPAHSSSPRLDRLFELCEEGLTAGDDNNAWRAHDPESMRPPEADLAPYRTDEGPPMNETTHVSAGSADVETEMFVVAMDALARALLDEDEVVRTASMSALQGLDPEAVRSWAASRVSTGAPEEARAAEVIIEALNRHDVAVPLLEQACAATGPEQERAIVALRALAPDTETLARLVYQLGESTRVQATSLLTRLLAGDALGHMVEVMARDPSERVRLAALEALAEYSDLRAVLRIASRAVEHDDSPAVRVAAASLLGRVGAGELGQRSLGGGHREAVEQPTLDDPDALWHFLVAHESRTDASAIPDAARRDPELLLDVALSHADDPDPAARALAVGAALAADEAGVGREDGVVMAVLALGDPDPRVRRAAVDVCRPDTTEWTSAIRHLIADPDREVRAKAASALARSDDEEATASLVVALADPEVDIREIASTALRGRVSAPLAGLLVGQLEATCAREAATELLVAMGDIGRRAVDDAFPSLSVDARLVAGKVLASAGGDVHRHLAELTSLDPRARLRAARVLGTTGAGPEVVERLVARLLDPAPEIRVEVVELLARLGGPEIEPMLRRVVTTDPVEAVAEAAARSLAVAWRRGPG